MNSAFLCSRYPIVQAPMAGVGGVELAVAAMEGGAVGSLPCAMLNAAEVRKQATEVRSRCSGPLNLNFFCHVTPEGADDSAWRALLKPWFDAARIPPNASGSLRRPFDAAMCEAVEDAQPELVSFHFGLPEPALLERVRRTGACILGNATTIAEARRLAHCGVDAVIAQSWEAGGHAGRFLSADPAEQMGLLALLPQIVDAIDLPVIAAGGIADGRGIAAAFALGADAVQIGTAYLHCLESLISPEHRAALSSEAAERTGFTNLYSGGLARGLQTPLTDALGRVRSEAPPFPLAGAAISALGLRPMFTGQAARLGKAEPARALTERLGRDALAVIG